MGLGIFRIAVVKDVQDDKTMILAAFLIKSEI